MSSGKKKARAPEGPGFPAAVSKALARLSEATIEPGWSASNLSAKRGGKIFLLLVKGELVFKLPKPRVDELVAASGGRRFDPRKNGRVMKEWVVLPLDVAGAAGLALEAYRFASGER